MRVRADDVEYQRLAVREAEFWDRPQFFSSEAMEAVAPDAPFVRYNNERLTGDPRVPWYETIPHYGQFKRGLFLGVSGMVQEARVLQQNPSLRLTFIDISPASLEKRRSELGTRFAGRVDASQADLNFLDMPEASYDVIVSAGALHHVINIEHVAQQIARSLTPGGYFFLQDYVAEDKFQFSAGTRRLWETMIEAAKRRGDVPRSWRTAWPELAGWESSVFSPFEAIRAEDTIPVLDAHLQRLSLRTSGALTGLLVFVKLDEDDARSFESPMAHARRRKPYSPRRRLRVWRGQELAPAMAPAFQRELFLLDGLMCDSGILRPFNAFAVYRRP